MAPFTPLADPVIEYPESDGKPIGETDFHITANLTLLQLLRDFFIDAERVYASADMMFYYEQGNPKAVKAPDVFVVKGVDKHKRRIYKLWEEGIAPCTIFEITSKETRNEDRHSKYALYQRLGVREYFLFDPLGEYLTPRLQGFTLEAGRYRPIVAAADGALGSAELGLMLKSEGDLLRIIDAASGRRIPTSTEAVARLWREMQRAEAEAQRADTATQRADTATQRAEAEAQRADTATQRADTATQRAEAEAQRAEAEAQRADEIAAKLAQLQAELERLQR